VGALEDQALLLMSMAELNGMAGPMADAGTHLREALEVASGIGDWMRLGDCLDRCGHLCGATGRWDEAVTIWAARTGHLVDQGQPDLPEAARDRQEPLQEAAQALGPARMRAA